jgi:hypothetical protein
MIRTPAPFEAHDLSRLGCLLLGGPLTKLLAQVMQGRHRIHRGHRLQWKREEGVFNR